MRLVFDPDLATLDTYAEGATEIVGVLGGSAEDGDRVHLARFERPVLVTDPHRIGLLPPARRDVVHSFFGLPQRTIEYDGAELAFDAVVYPRVWSPSIDTLLVCKALRALLPELAAARSLLEIGSGSGFIALYGMHAIDRAGRALDEVHIVDIEPQAIECGMTALEERAGRTLVTASLGRRGEALRVRGRYDLVLMNPPYIRRPDELSEALYEGNPWEGVALIRELCDRGPDILTPGGSIMMVISSLCDDLVMPWLEARYRVERLLELEVPLKVYAVTSGLTAKSRAWMEFLESVEGLRRCDPPRDGYDLWQRLTIVRCRLP
jgi:methylase of polypeptide subunit release factors